MNSPVKALSLEKLIFKTDFNKIKFKLNLYLFFRFKNIFKII